MLTNDGGLRQHGGMFVRPKQPNRLNLTGVDLSGAKLVGAKLTGADLTGADLTGADLARANLFRVDLSGAKLTGADLSGADLTGAKLVGAKLTGADLTGADLSGADLSVADLSRADLTGAKLVGAKLTGADLTGVKLTGADLTGADLARANLFRVDLSGAKLAGANLSQCKGLPVSPHVFLETHPDGVVAYKAFGNTTRQALPHWVVEVGAVIEEPGCNPDRFTECGSGVNVASTLTWVKANYPDADSHWRVLIKWADLPNTVVPYTSDGKYRTTRITLLEEVD